MTPIPTIPTIARIVAPPAKATLPGSGSGGGSAPGKSGGGGHIRWSTSAPPEAAFVICLNNQQFMQFYHQTFAAF